MIRFTIYKSEENSCCRHTHVAGLVIMSNFKQLNMDLPQLNENLF
jgi:hypothetical protein